MKFAKFLMVFLTIAPQFAFAGTLTDKSYQLAALLGSREPSLTPTQASQVSRKLDELLALVNGSNPGNEKTYLCVSRDNDNTRPYVLAYKDFANVVRIPGAAFNSKQECEQSLSGAMRVMDRMFVCSTRDNDGSRPFKIVALNGTATAVMMQRSVLNTLDECMLATRSMQMRPEGVLYCGSRDNDGSRPFTQTGYKFDGTFVQSREEYNTLNDCNSAL